jgi:hypothetical protein
MRANRLIPIAVLAFAVACSDTATSPTLTSVGGPLSAAISPGALFGPAALNAGGTPSGGHLQSGSIFCAVSSTLVITCSSTGEYKINGIGNTNANAALSATYSATVHCTNKGGNLVEVKSQPQTAPATSGTLRAKNGSLTVTQISTSPPTNQQFEAAATCPNGNWSKSVAPGPTLESFTYTLTFVGFSTPAVSISGS